MQYKYLQNSKHTFTCTKVIFVSEKAKIIFNSKIHHKFLSLWPRIYTENFLRINFMIWIYSSTWILLDKYLGSKPSI